jgi:hypothetical protein
VVERILSRPSPLMRLAETDGLSFRQKQSLVTQSDFMPVRIAVSNDCDAAIAG